MKNFLRNNFLLVILFYFFYSIFSKLKLRFKITNKSILNKNVFDLNIKKDSCFIMASGSSVNDINSKQFDIIKKNFSIGINSWFLHDFISDMYMYEAGDPSWSEAHKIFEYLESNYKKFTHIPILMPYDSFWFDKNIKHLRDNNKIRILYYYVLPFFFTKKKNIIKSYKNQRKLQNLLKFSSGVYGSGSSIIRSICLAEELGFKEIILVGVDLNNTDYFYELDNSYLKKRGIDTYGSSQKGAIHLTNDPNAKNIILEDFIKAVNKEPTFKAKIYTTSIKSALYPTLDLYDWKK